MVSSIRRLALQTGPGTKLRQRYRSLRAVQVLGIPPGSILSTR